MKIEIDPYSGFCFGVISAIEKAENFLKTNRTLYCLGDLVHNNLEMERLQKQGLITINYEQFQNLTNTTVLIRAHGEPPETYEIAKRNHITLIDATCPVVLRLQKKIKKKYESDAEVQILIFGKQGHAEVNGLVGQTRGKAIVINSLNDIDKIDFQRPIAIYSQTTQSPQKYNELIKEIRKKMEQYNVPEHFLTFTNSICGQVSLRDKKLKAFAHQHDVVLFVSGKQSSNGKALFNVCKQANARSYFISSKEEIDFSWFKDAQNVGISGATSTPMWLMKEIAVFLEQHLMC